jgi:large subunit ribosomal protein L35Ae
MIVEVSGVDSRAKAHDLIGKSVVWETPSKEKKSLKGIVAQEHGTKGALRVRFETGMPGQSLGQKVVIS